jgi:hypothetical protein
MAIECDRSPSSWQAEQTEEDVLRADGVPHQVGLFLCERKGPLKDHPMIQWPLGRHVQLGCHVLAINPKVARSFPAFKRGSRSTPRTRAESHGERYASSRARATTQSNSISRGSSSFISDSASNLFTRKTLSEGAGRLAVRAPAVRGLDSHAYGPPLPIQALPTIAAGVADDVWTCEEITPLLDSCAYSQVARSGGRGGADSPNPSGARASYSRHNGAPLGRWAQRSFVPQRRYG